MNFKNFNHLLIVSLVMAVTTPASAGLIFQNFEPDNGAPPVLNPVGSATVLIVDRAEAVHLGVKAVKASSADYWTGFGVMGQVNGGNTDLKGVNNDRLTFWIYALPNRNCTIVGCEPGTDNNVGVTFYDQSNYRVHGFEVWTTQTARYGQWSKLKVLFSQLPPDFNLRQVVRVEFKNYWPGRYYFDDIHAVREDRVYQAFEPEERSGSAEHEYGWKWNSNDTVAVSTASEPSYDGRHSWKLLSTARWGGTGIQSQDKRYVNKNGTAEQSFWSVDLDPDNNDRLTFWMYGLPENAMDNNIGVQFYDNGAHFTDDTKVQVWTKTAATVGRWSRLTVLFSDLRTQAPDLNLRDINKIQFQAYWPGTYFLDDIRAAGPQTKILESSFARGMIEWRPVPGAARYRLQESLSGPEGPWKTIFSGPQTSFRTTRLSKSWLRVRWEEAFQDRNSLPYTSDWSDVTEYLPPAVVLTYNRLAQGSLTWTAVSQTDLYEVEKAPAKSGPWTRVHKGGVPFFPLKAELRTWYRIRGISETGGVVNTLTPWSRPQVYAPGENFVRSTGTVIKDANGTGDTLVLSGVNLGGAFVIEPWMTGLGNGDTPPLPDDWSIRERLGARFGAAKTEQLLRHYEQSYGNTFDFDRFLDRGITLVRLPFYYRNFQDDNGKWISPPSDPNTFRQLDAVVNALADRGIYTLLDMHGAPGLQSAEATTGRAGFNQLFASGGEFYRKRTEQLWKEIALHYRDNPWVLGYDLLNEPIGATPRIASLANMYDRLYRTIRSVDPHHLIVMEGVWFTNPKPRKKDPEYVDWDTLPPPKQRHWTNVMYQFHWYHWYDTDAEGNRINTDENFDSHKAFIDQKLAAAAVAQPDYNVPLMIGEFYGFNMKSIWDYYLTSFNSRGWSWTSWSSKHHDSPSTWGWVAHAGYDEALPNFGNDSYDVLERKLSKYSTADYHAPTVAIQELLQAKGLDLQAASDGKPGILSVSPSVSQPGQTLTVEGWNFGVAQNGSRLSCNSVPIPVLSWSDRLIRAALNTSFPAGLASILVETTRGTSNRADFVLQAAPLPPSLTTSSGKTFTLQGSELGDTPGTFQFYPAPCHDNPPGTIPCNHGDAGISFWSKTLVQGTVPPDAADLGSRFTLRTQEGGALYPTMLQP